MTNEYAEKWREIETRVRESLRRDQERLRANPVEEANRNHARNLATTMRQMTQDNADMELALRAMAYLLHEEYGQGPISELHRTYGKRDGGEMEALKRLEANWQFSFLLNTEDWR